MATEMILISANELRALIEGAVSTAIQISQKPKAESKYLSVEEMAEFLKLKVSTIYQHHSRGLLPGGRKLNGRLLFDRAEVEAWAEERRILSTEQAVEAHHKRRGS